MLWQPHSVLRTVDAVILNHHPSVQNPDNFEYELPADFEDEEIDEDAAFTEEDKKLYAGWFEDTEATMAAGGNEALNDGLLDSEDDAEDGEDAYDTDDFSEEVRPCPMPALM